MAALWLADVVHWSATNGAYTTRPAYFSTVYERYFGRKTNQTLSAPLA